MNIWKEKAFLGTLRSRKNWEDDVAEVCVEACDCAEDPLGYRAVFFVKNARENPANKFVVGASFLAKRHENLNNSGYTAPMTERAIAMIERKIGHHIGDSVMV